MKSSLVTVLLVFSLSLVVSGVYRNERKRWESVFKTLFEKGDTSKGPTVPLEFVGQELEKWRWVHESDKYKLLSTESSGIMDRLKVLNMFTGACDNDHLKNRLALERRFDDHYVNLHPYIKFTNLMLFNTCYQEYEYKLMLSLNANLDKSKFLAWYDATEGEMGEPQSEMAALRSEQDPNMTTLNEEDPELADVAAKLALYLKHFYPKIESKYFKSSEEHADKIKFEVKGILNAVCPRITNLNSYSASGYEISPTSQQQIPTITMSHGQFPIDAEYQSLMKDVSMIVNGGDFAFTGLYKYQWICEVNYSRQLIEHVQRYFGQFLDERQFDDIISADSTNISQQDLISTKQILFAEDEYPKLRMGHQYELLDRLNIGSKDGSLAEVPDNLADLIKLRQISPDELVMYNLGLEKRLDLEATYDDSYVVLHPYIASLNRLQFDLYNQILRQIASSIIPPDPVQLAKLEKLRTLIGHDSHESVEPDAFAKAVADLFFLSSTCKVPKKLVASKMQELLEETCAYLTHSLAIKFLLKRHDALIKHGLVGPLNDATKRALSYGRICKYYYHNKSQLAPQLFNPDGWYKTAPQRYPKHLSGPSLLSCLKPQVM